MVLAQGPLSLNSALPAVVRHASAVPCASDNCFWASPLVVCFQFEGVPLKSKLTYGRAEPCPSQQLAKPNPVKLLFEAWLVDIDEGHQSNIADFLKAEDRRLES